MMLTLVRATPAHIRILASRARPEEEAETRALTQETVLEAGLASLRASTIALAAFADDELVAAFGVVPNSALLGVGVPWVLGSGAVEKRRRFYAVHSRAALARLLAVYPTLVTLLDCRYVRAVRWARWLGFSVSEPFEYGPEGRQFVFIERRA